MVNKYISISYILILLMLVPCVSAYTAPLGFEFELDNHEITSNIFEPATTILFNLTNSSRVIFLNSMQLEKTSGGGASQVFGQVYLDGVLVSDSQLSTMTSTGQPKISSLKNFIGDVGLGEHNITLFFRRTSNGVVEVTHFESIVLINETINSTELDFRIENYSYTVNSGVFTSYIDRAITINKPTFVEMRTNIITSVAATVTSFFDNVNDSLQSPYFSRTTQSSTDIGTTMLPYIDDGTSDPFNYSLYSLVSAGTAVVNQTLTFIELNDTDYVNNAQATNPNTNITNTVSVSSSFAIVNASLTLQEGDSIAVLYGQSLSSTTGSQTLDIWINETSGVCNHIKHRYFMSPGIIGNVFDTEGCENLTLGNTYNFSVFIVPSVGETISALDENLVLFEYTRINTSQSIFVPPPVHVIETTFVNNSDVNLSVVANFINAKFISGNDTLDVLRLYINGSSEQNKTFTNDTYDTFTITSIVSPGDYTFYINSSYNSSGDYFFRVTNTSHVETTTGDGSSYIAIVIAMIFIIIFIMFLCYNLNFGVITVKRNKQNYEIPYLKYGILLIAGWMCTAVADLAVQIVRSENFFRLEGSTIAIYSALFWTMISLSFVFGLFLIYIILYKFLEWGGAIE